MSVSSTFKDGRLTLYLRGELDHHSAREEYKNVDRLIDEYLPRDCVIDLGGLSFMDSSGIAVILKIHKKLSGMGGRAWVEKAQKQPLRVIDAAGIDRLIKISTSVKE